MCESQKQNMNGGWCKRKISQQLTEMLGKRNCTFIKQEAPEELQGSVKILSWSKASENTFPASLASK